MLVESPFLLIVKVLQVSREYGYPSKRTLSPDVGHACAPDHALDIPTARILVSYVLAIATGK